MDGFGELAEVLGEGFGAAGGVLQGFEAGAVDGVGAVFGQDGEDGFGGECVAVGALGVEGVEDVGDYQDAGGEVEGGAFDAAEVAGAV